MSGGKVGRRASVEVALVRSRGKVNQSALARRLGVSRATVRRDIERIQARWAALGSARGEDLLAELAGTADMLERIAWDALEQYHWALDYGPQHAVAIGYLRTAMDALDRRAKLLGLPGLADLREDSGEMRFIVDYEGSDKTEIIESSPRRASSG